jgi:hypothetical protein
MVLVLVLVLVMWVVADVCTHAVGGSSGRCLSSQ